ncbi:MAG: hypothetical protein Q8Q88_20235 [Phenylobacterium sp.]|uniref:hypothetical protein n=1 Tax=Phenylobacterium sp. TaxID=1871053 RepID=UPI0027342731|nr:hypothetical protein [Phenylobacterium sp.]MDP3749372.1 hypothetical protein [Phenylobacterium sp.]
MQRTLAAALLALGCATSASATTLPQSDRLTLLPWGSFSSEPGLRGSPLTQIEVLDVLLRADGAASPWQRFWLLEKIVKAPGKPDSLQWADSRACGAVKIRLAALEKLEPAKVELTPRPSPSRAGVTMLKVPDVDAPTYVIDAPSKYRSGGAGRVRLSAGANSSVGQWVDRTMRDLASCWRDRPPV